MAHMHINIIYTLQSSPLHLSIPTIDGNLLLPLRRETVIKLINTMTQTACLSHCLLVISLAIILWTSSHSSFLWIADKCPYRDFSESWESSCSRGIKGTLYSDYYCGLWVFYSSSLLSYFDVEDYLSDLLDLLTAW
jgi:hypothetical protein